MVNAAIVSSASSRWAYFVSTGAIFFGFSPYFIRIYSICYVTNFATKHLSILVAQVTNCEDGNIRINQVIPHFPQVEGQSAQASKKRHFG
jgi:hypothetical protein